MYTLDEKFVIINISAALALIVVGSTLILLHNLNLGLPFLIGGIIPLMTNGVPLLLFYLGRQKAIRGVLKVMTREEGVIFEAIEKDLKSAKSIQIVGNILYRDLFGVEKFNKILEGRANDDFKIKICLYKPDNQYLRIRSSDEIVNHRIEIRGENRDDIEQKAKANFGRMNAEIGETLDKIKNLKKKLKEKLKVKLIDWTYILDSIIIIDDKIIVVDYLHQRGRGSPVFVLKDNPVCKAYQKEFERIWNYSGSEEL